MFQGAQLAQAAISVACTDDTFDELIAGRALDSSQAEQLFSRLVAGQLTEAEIAVVLVALRLKGETADELIGAARALRAAALHFDRRLARAQRL